MMEILVTIPVQPQHKISLENAVKGTKAEGQVHFTYLTQAEVTKDQICHADIILGNVAPEYLKAAEHLKFMQLDSAGADAYTEQGILPKGAMLANATGAYGPTMSEHMLGCALMLLKRLYLYQGNMQKHVWRDEGKVQSITDSTTLIIGMGDIGSNFAMKMHALGSHVIGIRRNKAKRPDYLDELYQMDSLDSLLPRSDIVACSLPGTKETEHMLDASRLGRMKKGAILINVGRGSLIPTNDLYEALAGGHLGGAAIDVTEEEPLPEDSRLWDAPNLLITPHISGNYHTQHILESVVQIATYNLRVFLEDGKIQNEVDFQTGYRKYIG